jgi:hypothetical protein
VERVPAERALIGPNSNHTNHCIRVVEKFKGHRESGAVMQSRTRAGTDTGVGTRTGVGAQTGVGTRTTKSAHTHRSRHTHNQVNTHLECKIFCISPASIKIFCISPALIQNILHLAAPRSKSSTFLIQNLLYSDAPDQNPLPLIGFPAVRSCSTSAVSLHSAKEARAVLCSRRARKLMELRTRKLTELRRAWSLQG